MKMGRSRGGRWHCRLGLFRGMLRFHAALFVHRVRGLLEGLYFLVRNEDGFDELKKSMRSSFTWVKLEGCSEDLPLYELHRTDCGALAEKLPCHQDDNSIQPMNNARPLTV